MDTNDKVLIFDVSAPFAHFKRIFATTSALTYPLPPKTTVYGLIGAILGLEKTGNVYLNEFAPGCCRIGIRIEREIATQRISMNLRPSFGSLRATENRKPTLMEFVDRPRYRIYFQHTDAALYQRFSSLLRAGKSTYTPTLGLANLIAKVVFIAEAEAVPETTDRIDSVIPKSRLTELLSAIPGQRNHLMEAGQYAVEMEPSRDVTVRDSILLDRAGAAIPALATDTYRINYQDRSEYVVLF